MKSLSSSVVHTINQSFFSAHHSVNQPFKGDYLEIGKNPKYQKLSSAVDEKVLLADVVNKINRANGKVHPLSRALLPFRFIPLEKSRRVNSFFSDLKGTARIFLLTKNSVFLADQKTGQVKASVPLPDLASVSVSTQADGFFALKLKEVRNVPYFHLNQITARLVPFQGLSFARAILQMFHVWGRKSVFQSETFQNHTLAQSNKSICGCIFSVDAVLEVHEYIVRH